MGVPQSGQVTLVSLRCRSQVCIGSWNHSAPLVTRLWCPKAPAVPTLTNLPGMDELANRFADFLEENAAKVRAMTVDRVDRGLKITAGAMVAGMLVLIVLIFLLIALVRALGELITIEGAYLLLGGLLVVAGAFAWSRRTDEDRK